MKTHDLVELLARDGTRLPATGRALGRALLPAGVFSAAVLLAFPRVRPDLAEALATLRFDFKILLNLALCLAALGLLLRLVRPAARRGGWGVALWAVPAVLAMAAVAELFVLPPEQWWPAAHGHNSTWCLRIIPALGIVPLLATLFALRRSAPERPAVAGAVAGLMSAGLAGALYALHCPDDSPLFVGIWYVLATGVLAAAGALLGRRLLRW